MTERRWTADKIPDQHGRVAIVTGANSGIGYETARVLADRGATVVMACRSEERGSAALAAIQSRHPHADVSLRSLDLADLDSIRAFAEDMIAEQSALHLLINNAGVMALPERRETDDGFEMQFGVNHLGHFALTGLLLGPLLGSKRSRVVTVSSTAHRMGFVRFSNLNAERDYQRWAAYGLSKLSNLLFAYELQRRLEAIGAETISVAAHPGYTATNLQQHTGATWLNPIIGQSPEMGALPTLRAATAHDVQGGDYYGPGGLFEARGYPIKVSSNRRSHDMAVAQQLWEVSEQMTGVSYNFVNPDRATQTSATGLSATWAHSSSN